MLLNMVILEKRMLSNRSPTYPHNDSLCTCRYVVCHGLRPESKKIADYMYQINVTLRTLSDTNRDVLEVCVCRREGGM